MALRTTHSVGLALLLIACAAPASAAPSSTRLTTASTKALMRGDTGQALTLANRAIAANPRDPWAYYGQGAAFNAFGRTDAAVRSYAQARDLFGAANARGRLLAIYGIARAYDNAGRCSEARSAYLQYARLAGPRAGRRALVYGKACRSASPVAPSAALIQPDVPSEPSGFDEAALAYRDELIGQTSPGVTATPEATERLLALLASAIEQAPGARDSAIAYELEPMRSGSAREALLAASYALSLLANGPYANSTSVHDEVSAFRREVLRVDPELVSPSEVTPLVSALDHADRVLQAIAQAQAQAQAQARAQGDIIELK